MSRKRKRPEGISEGELYFTWSYRMVQSPAFRSLAVLQSNFSSSCAPISMAATTARLDWLNPTPPASSTLESRASIEPSPNSRTRVSSSSRDRAAGTAGWRRSGRSATGASTAAIQAIGGAIGSRRNGLLTSGRTRSNSRADGFPKSFLGSDPGTHRGPRRVRPRNRKNTMGPTPEPVRGVLRPATGPTWEPLI